MRSKLGNRYESYLLWIIKCYTQISCDFCSCISHMVSFVYLYVFVFIGIVYLYLLLTLTCITIWESVILASTLKGANVCRSDFFFPESNEWAKCQGGVWGVRFHPKMKVSEQVNLLKSTWKFGAMVPNWALVLSLPQIRYVALGRSVKLSESEK